jgi:hypothetical protein
MAVNIIISSICGTAWTAMQRRARASRSEHGDEAAGHEQQPGQLPMPAQRHVERGCWFQWALPGGRMPRGSGGCRRVRPYSDQRASAVAEHSLATCRGLAFLPLMCPRIAEQHLISNRLGGLMGTCVTHPSPRRSQSCMGKGHIAPLLAEGGAVS